MNRIYLLLLLAAPLLANSEVQAASRVERGNLTFDNIPQVSADLAEKLDGYRSMRARPTPLGWSPTGQIADHDFASRAWSISFIWLSRRAAPGVN